MERDRVIRREEEETNHAIEGAENGTESAALRFPVAIAEATSESTQSSHLDRQGQLGPKTTPVIQRRMR